MRTAEEWQSIQPAGNTLSLDMIKRIQLDAFKSGLIRAATLTQKAKDNWDAYHAIMELATTAMERDL